VGKITRNPLSHCVPLSAARPLTKRSGERPQGGNSMVEFIIQVMRRSETGADQAVTEAIPVIDEFRLGSVSG